MTTFAGASVGQSGYPKAESVLGGTTTTLAYEYDEPGRLVEVSINGTPTASYSYDANDNRTSRSLPGTGYICYYSHDAQDRLTKTTDTLGITTDYAYTPFGDLRTKTRSGDGTTTYTYDEMGNLLTVKLPDSATVDYVVDGANRRIGRKVNGSWTQKWLYSGGLHPVAELNGSNSIVSIFDGPFMVKNGTMYRVIRDERGSVRLVVNASTGAVVQRMDYDEYGMVTNDTNPGFQPFGFAGGLYDPATGLVRLGARDYDPEIGRWTCKDPSGFEGGLNLYGYCGGDPVNYVDVTGEMGVLAAVAVGIGIGIVVGLAIWAISDWMGAPLNPAEQVAWLFNKVRGAAVCTVAKHNPDEWQEGEYSDPGGDAPWHALAEDANDTLATGLAVGGLVGAVVSSGQWHHAISKGIGDAIEKHPNLAGRFTARDSRFVTQAADWASHNGYQKWHREYDAQVIKKIQENRDWTPRQFEQYLRNLYSEGGLNKRFPNGLP